MDLRDIELYVEKFLEMCRNHPKLCPHDYISDGCGYRPDGKFENRYKCDICGHKKSDVYDVKR